MRHITRLSLTLGGTVIFLDVEAACDSHVLAHEIGHVANYLAGADRDFRRPVPKLARLAKRCGLDESSRESNDEMMAECTARRVLKLPLYPQLHAFCEKSFQTVRTQ
jgi:hypothetical protein